MKLESFKELMGVETIEFNQYTEGKRMIADVKGVDDHPEKYVVLLGLILSIPTDWKYSGYSDDYGEGVKKAIASDNVPVKASLLNAEPEVELLGYGVMERLLNK